jgi:PBP1b-binding outer membrane lipoprotein LpoB
MRALGVTIIAILAVGCSQESQSMTKKDENTLKGNLNSPVDVAKIRAEYNKNKPAETGIRPANDGM